MTLRILLPAFVLHLLVLSLEQLQLIFLFLQIPMNKTSFAPQTIALTQSHPPVVNFIVTELLEQSVGDLC